MDSLEAIKRQIYKTESRLWDLKKQKKQYEDRIKDLNKAIKEINGLAIEPINNKVRNTARFSSYAIQISSGSLALEEDIEKEVEKAPILDNFLSEALGSLKEEVNITTSKLDKVTKEIQNTSISLESLKSRERYLENNPQK